MLKSSTNKPAMDALTKKVPMLRNLSWVEGCLPTGTLEAVACGEAGKEIARDKITTAGHQQVFASSRKNTASYRWKRLDLHLHEIVDSEGNVVPTANNNSVRFNCMDKVNWLVLIMGNKPAVNATRHNLIFWIRRALTVKAAIVKLTEQQVNYRQQPIQISLKSESSNGLYW